MKKRPEREIAIVSLLLGIIGALSLFTTVSLTGYAGHDIAVGEPSQTSIHVKEEDTRSIAISRCQDLHPAESTDYYVDPEGACAPCSDSNAGTITKPWCTLERALEQSKSPHLSGGDRLYLRQGIHRYDGLKITPPAGALSGTTSRPTVIAGYPQEKARVYGSLRVTGWEKRTLPDGSFVWTFRWRNYLEKNKPLYLASQHPTIPNLWTSFAQDFTDVPQAVFIDSDSSAIHEPVILKQANEKKTAAHLLYHRDGDPNLINDERLYFRDYTTMPAGYAYYERDINSKDRGMLFIKPPAFLAQLNPDDLPIEIPLSYLGFLGPYPQNHVIVANISHRFTNGFPDGGFNGGFILNGDSITLEGMDISYHTFRGLVGGGDHNIIRNSTIAYNGNMGSGRVGTNITYEGNIFRNNGWRPFQPQWDSGGMKLIDNKAQHNFTIRNNFFMNNDIGLWFDFTGDGSPIKDGQKNWDSYTGAGHLVENNVFLDDLLALETSPGSEKNPIVIRNNVFLGQDNPNRVGIAIQSAPHVRIMNNVFVNLDQGVLAQGAVTPIPSVKEDEYRVRTHVHDIFVSKNIFVNVSFPVIFGEESTYLHPKYVFLFTNNRAEDNVYYGTKKPSPFFQRMREVDFSRSFVPLVVSHPLHQKQYTIDQHAYDKDENAQNGISPGIMLTREAYDWYQQRTLEELESTPYFTKGMIYSLNYVDAGAYRLYTLSEWQTQTKNDLHSLTENPRLSMSSSNVLSVQESSPSVLLGMKALDFSRVLLPVSQAILTTPRGTSSTQRALDMNYTYSGAALQSCWYSLNGGITNHTLVCLANLTQVPAQEGTNSWSIFLQDELLRVHALRATFSVDREPPMIRSTSVEPPSPLTITPPARVTFSAEIEDAEQATLVLDHVRTAAQHAQGNTYRVELSDLKAGNHEYSWEARDAAGNVASSHVLKYTVQEPPRQVVSRLVLEFPRDQGAYQTADALAYTVSEDAVACWYSLDGGLTNTTLTCGQNVSALSPAEGVHTWLAGMRTVQEKIFTSKARFLVDRTPPVITLKDPTPRDQAMLTRDSIVINASVSDASLQRVEYVLRNSTRLVAHGLLYPPSFSDILTSLTPDSYVLVVNATDKAGNVKVSEPRRFTIVREQQQPPAQVPQQPSPSQQAPEQQQPTQTPPLVVYRISHDQLNEGASLKVKEGEELLLERSGTTHALRLSISSDEQALLFFRGIYYTLALGTPYYLEFDAGQKSGVTLELSSVNLLERSISGRVSASSAARRQAADISGVQQGQQEIPSLAESPPASTLSTGGGSPLSLPVAEEQPEQPASAENETVQEETPREEQKPKKSLLESTDRIVLLLALILGAASLLAVLLYWLLGRPVSSPVSRRTPYDY